MIKRIAVIFGIVLVVVGILGFIPGITTFAPDVDHGRLLGIFAVDTMHDMVHIFTGAIAVWMGLTGEAASRSYFRAVGIAYGIVALLGFGYGNAPLFGMMANNTADAALHVVIALVALVLGFGHLVERYEHRSHHPA
ncbi:MAG: DUF4383 domain-containing protein [Ignavibacteria bacterium]